MRPPPVSQSHCKARAGKHRRYGVASSFLVDPAVTTKLGEQTAKYPREVACSCILLGAELSSVGCRHDEASWWDMTLGARGAEESRRRCSEDRED